MKKSDRRAAADLSSPEKAFRLLAFHVPENQNHAFADEKAQGKAHNYRDDQTIDDFDPFASVDAFQSAVQSNGSSGQARDQRMAFTCRNSEIPGKNGPYDDGEEGGA